MKNEQGFSLVELLIVVAIIAIIAAIAIPALLTSRMAANEAGGVEGCRTAGSAEVAFAATNNQLYAVLADLVAGQFLDSRYTNANGFNGYTYAEDQAIAGMDAGIPNTVAANGFGIIANPVPGSARYGYGIGPEQVVRVQSFIAPAIAYPGTMVQGDAIGKR